MEMKYSKTKFNGIKKIGFFLIAWLTSCTAFSFYQNVRMPDTPLTISLFPIQKGTVNSIFSFDISPYISRIKTEVKYQISNESSFKLEHGKFWGAIPGVTPVYSGSGLCQHDFTLLAFQSCVARFYIDKNLFNHIAPPAPSFLVHIMSQPMLLAPTTTLNEFRYVVPELPNPTQVSLIQGTLPPGLHFNPNTLVISGTPSTPGSYAVKVSASDGATTAEPREIQFLIGFDLRNKPMFKTNPIIPSATPNQDYQINLMDLIEPKKDFMVNNQVTFRIDKGHSHPTWLAIDPENTTILKGHVPSDGVAGQTIEITLYATSNTGGDSSPQTIKIPVAFDPAKKPIIDSSIVLTAAAGQAIHKNFRDNIKDPAEDGNLKVHIEHIEPNAPWLQVSTANPTELEGLIPDTDAGTKYLISLTASTPTGGKSDEVVIPLNIAINKYLTPRFYQDNPVLPFIYEGQSVLYDFVANNDVNPEYTDFPYIIELAKDYVNPNWVTIKDNKLIIEKVPKNSRSHHKVYVTIKNVPGGISDVFTVDLFINK